MKKLPECFTSKTGHPWKSWFGLGEFTLVKNVHFSGTPESMESQVRRAAKIHGYRVRVSVRERAILVKVLGVRDGADNVDPISVSVSVSVSVSDNVDPTSSNLQVPVSNG